MKRLTSLLVLLAMAASLAVPAAAAESAEASTMRLESAEGTVTVKNASGLAVELKDKMRLYDGYTVKTAAKSYAYISLDGDKSLKLDASSEASVNKSGKKLEIALSSGSMFFNVSKPLENSEKLNIRTATIVTGIRGTAACVKVPSRDHTEISLLTGRLDVTGRDSCSGEMETVEMVAGEVVVASQLEAGTPQEHLEIQKLTVQEVELPGFAAVEVAKDPELQSKITEETELSVPLIIGDAEERLTAEQTAAQEKETQVQQQLERQEQQPQAETVEPVFQGGESAPGSDPGDSGDSSDSDPGPVQPPEPEKPDPPVEPGPTPAPVTTKTLDNPTLEQLRDALNDATLTTINVTNVQLNVAPSDAAASGFEIPADKTLNLKSGTLTFGQDVPIDGALATDSGTTLTVSSGYTTVTGSLTVNGAVDVNGGMLLNNGTLTVPGTLTISSNTLTNNKTMTVSGTLTVNGDLSNSGTLSVPGTLELAYINEYQRGTLTNTGEMTVSGPMTMNEHSKLDVGATDGSKGTVAITVGGSIDAKGTITVYPGSTFQAAAVAGLGLTVTEVKDGASVSTHPELADGMYSYTNSTADPAAVSMTRTFTLTYTNPNACGYEVTINGKKADHTAVNTFTLYEGEDVYVELNSGNTYETANLYAELYAGDDAANGKKIKNTSGKFTFTGAQIGEYMNGFSADDGNDLTLIFRGLDRTFYNKKTTMDEIIPLFSDPAIRHVSVNDGGFAEGEHVLNQPLTIHSGQHLSFMDNEISLILNSPLTVDGIFSFVMSGLEVTNNSTLTVGPKGSLSVGNTCTLYNNGSLTIAEGGSLECSEKLENKGTLENNGKLIVTNLMNAYAGSTLVNNGALIAGSWYTDHGIINLVTGATLINSGTVSLSNLCEFNFIGAPKIEPGVLKIAVSKKGVIGWAPPASATETLKLTQNGRELSMTESSGYYTYTNENSSTITVEAQFVPDTTTTG